MSRPIVLVGTGTSVGKTYTAERLLRAFAYSGRPAAAYKPIETGIDDDSTEDDGARLARAASFHVKPELARTTFPTPVSPHLAARLAGRRVDLDLIASEIRRGAEAAPVLVVELPGGAFSPLDDDGTTSADFVRRLAAARVILVAPNRLGVLHDVGAASRAFRHVGLSVAGIVLSTAAPDDESSSTNAAELPRVTDLPLLAVLPREAADGALHPEHPAVALARTCASV